MSEWKEYKLSDLAEITSSKRIFYSEYVTDGVPFYRSKEVINKFNKQEIKTELFISESKFNEIKSKFGVPVKNDILLTSVGTLGIPYLVSENDYFYFKDGNLTWFRNFDKSKIDIPYFYIWLQSKIGKQKLDEITIGSTQSALTISGLKSIEILLPNLKEQRSIASIIDSLGNKIDLLHSQNETIEKITDSLFRLWFEEEVKEDWTNFKVSDIANHIKKGIHPSKNPATLYHHFSLPAFDNGKKPVIELGSEIMSNKYQVMPNSVLISKLNPRIPRIWLSLNNVKDNSICSTEFQVIKPILDENMGFLYALLKSEMATAELTMSASGTSGSHQRVSPEDILNIAFQSPSEEYVLNFSKNIHPYLEKIISNDQQIQVLVKLRDSLLPKLMSGEVIIS